MLLCRLLLSPVIIAQVLAAKLFSIKLCYLSALSWHLYTLLIDGRANVTINNSQQVSPRGRPGM